MKLYKSFGHGKNIKKQFFLFQLVILAALICSSPASAQDYVGIEIWPPHVGVFTGVGEQQFTAYGTSPTGAKVDITKEVDWYLKEYPFAGQTQQPWEVACIDSDGYLTINEDVTWGRVSVEACYPKGCGAGLVRGCIGGINPGYVILGLLGPKFTVTPNVVGPGTIDPSSPVKVRDGKVFVFGIAPNRGYEVGNVTGCGGTWDSNDPFVYSTGTIDADCGVTATFNGPLPLYSLLITTDAGTGTGTVTSSPAGIDCGATCTDNFYEGETVTLTADPDPGSELASWGGDCVGTVNPDPNQTSEATVDMGTADKNCSATFNARTERILDVATNGTGTGTVTSDITGKETDGINCGVDCQETYWDGDQVNLSAVADTGSAFIKWDDSIANDCSSCGSNATCSVTMDAAKSCTATFDTTPTQVNLNVTVNASGGALGGVTSDPVGITCAQGQLGTCTYSFDANTTVRLAAAAGLGSFDSWGGDCTEDPTVATEATVDMGTTEKNCTALFVNP